MKNQYFKKRKVDLYHSKKLEFFKYIKVDYESENYLNRIRHFDQRRKFTKFRISDHKLAIETGRYFKENIQRYLRKYKCCNNDVIESEMHLLYHCPLYDNLRKELFGRINNRNQNNIFDNLEYTYDFFNSGNPSTNYYLSKFIEKCLKLRQEKLLENEQ